MKEHATSQVPTGGYLSISPLCERCVINMCATDVLYVQHTCVCACVHTVPRDIRNEKSTIHTHTCDRCVCKGIFVLQSKLQPQETACYNLKGKRDL